MIIALAVCAVVILGLLGALVLLPRETLDRD